MHALLAPISALLGFIGAWIAVLKFFRVTALTAFVATLLSFALLLTFVNIYRLAVITADREIPCAVDYCNRGEAPTQLLETIQQ